MFLNMKKIGIFCIVIMLIGLSISISIYSAETKIIKIGSVGPLSGTGAKNGIATKQGAELAVEEINEAGGIDGYKIQLICEDDKAIPAEAVNAVQKLIDRDKVLAIVGAFNSSCTIACMEVSRKAHVPQITPISIAEVITESGNKYIFRNVNTTPLAFRCLGEFIFDELKIKEMAMIYENTDYGKSMADFYHLMLEEERGGKIVAEVATNPGQSDFYAEVTKIIHSEPEAFFIGNYITEAVQILKQAKELGYKGRIVGAGQFTSNEFLKLAGKNAEGEVHLSFFEPVGTTSLAKRFIENYQNKYNIAPDMHAAPAYDAIYIIAEAIKKIGTDFDDLKLWREKLRDAMSETKGLVGVTGPTTFDEKGQATKITYIVQTQDGKRVVIGPSEYANAEVR